MKQLFFTGLACILVNQINAQSTTAGVGIGNVWAANKFLGWDGSSGVNPLLFKTNNLNRMKINGFYGAGQYTVNGYVGTTLGIDRSGYVLMGKDMPMSWGGPNELYSNYGAFSQLHLNGGIGADVQQFGYRPWMQAGVTFTDNQDLSYIGK